MKIITQHEKTITLKEQVIEVPDGDYCETESGIKCPHICYDISPFSGVHWHCDQFNCEFEVPYDNKPIKALRNIKKCEKCMNCEIKGE